MVAKNAGSATMKGESLWPRLAGLPLVIEACKYERLHAVLAYEFERITTHVRLVGAGADGLGEDVSVFREDGTALHETRPPLPLACLPPLRWAAPGAVAPGAGPPPMGRLVLRTAEPRDRARLQARQGERVLATGRAGRLVPNRSISLPAGWRPRVDPEGGPLFIRETIKTLDRMDLKPGDRRKIYFGNAMNMLRLQPPAEKARAKAKKKKK